ncbi:MAG: TolC family protein [Nitrospirae bacterium]|nr:TolC family protein [Nitrospirota bacterium]
MWKTAVSAFFLFCVVLVSDAKGGGDLHGTGRHSHPDYSTVRNPVPATEQSVVEGKALFKKHCAVCHGDDGKGKVGPDLTAPVLRHGQTAGEIFNIVSNGVPATEMKGFRESLEEEKRWHVVNFIEGLRKPFPEAVFTLEDLEKIALKKNPTLAQAASDIAAAEGRETQAGFYPNPLFGYEGEDISARAPGKSRHFFFWEQEFVTAGKLDLSRNILTHEKARAKFELEAQKQRVLNDVRSGYYEALGAQRLLEIRRGLSKIAHDAVGITEELYNIGQADSPDVLAAEIEAQKADIDLAGAETSYARIWKTVALLIGDPGFAAGRLADNLEEETPELDRNALLDKLLSESPQMKIIKVRIERARAAVESAKARRIPNFSLRVGLGYNFEEDSSGKRVGAEGNLGLRVPLPLFDRNQGNIMSAEAELRREELELYRLQMGFHASLSSLFYGYEGSLRTVTRYRQEILPKAKKAYELYLDKFRLMAAAYPQVLIARRAFFKVQADYIQALVDLRKKSVALQGLLLTGGLDPPGDQSFKSGSITRPPGGPVDR